MFLARLLVALLACGWSSAYPGNASSIWSKSFWKTLFNALNSDVCHSEACISAAENILSSIDKSINPCTDFYSFACNGWIKSHPIPPMSIQWNQFNVLNDRLDSRLQELLSEGAEENESEIIRDAKMVYEACMNDERREKRGISPLLKLLDEFNGWSVLSAEFSFFSRLGKSKWQDTVILASTKIGIAPLLLVGVDVDRRNTSRNVIIVEQPVSNIPAYLFNESTFIQQYAAHFTKVVQMMRKKKKLEAHVLGLHHHILGIIRFETQLRSLFKKKEEMLDLEKFHNPVTLKDLQEWTDRRRMFRKSTRINWRKYLKKLLGKGDSEIRKDTPVVVSDWEVLENILTLVDSTDPDIVNDYILWEVVKTMARSTNERMREMEFEFTSKVSGITEDIPKWQECVHATDNMAFAIGYMYVKKHFSDEAKAKAIAMVENIRQEFREELSEVTWIDEETKKAALDKADFMNHFIGYPNWYSNETALREHYKGLTIGKNHFENVLALKQFLAGKFFNRLDEEPRRDEWITGPAVINAYYDPRMNSIIFPAGILDAPFFNKDLPEALNYGSIGSIIGHEITHAFDDVGRQADKFGNIHQWWTEETEETYLKNAQCFIDEYGNFTFPLLMDVSGLNLTEGTSGDSDGKWDSNNGNSVKSLRLNGKLTLGENIADNGGLATALRAYLKRAKNSQKHIRLPNLPEYTPDHLFYLAFAMTWCETSSEASLIDQVIGDSHAPLMARVLGSLYNSQHFADTWGCPRGSDMNPEKKCQLW